MRLEALIAGILNVDESLLTDASGPATLGSWTSKTHFELVLALEEVYGIRLTRREIREMTTVSAARRLIVEKGAIAP
jgi:acyl carrier protein